jgi:hypothetical protein
MLTQHEPYPALVMDRYWNVVLTNEAAPRFFNCFIDLSRHSAPRNLLHLMFDPQGMRPFIANWEALAKTLLQRVQREAVGHVVDQKTKDLVADLLAYPDVQSDWKAPEMPLPMIPISFARDGAILNYFSLITTVGTPQTIAAQELRVECMYPADDETEALHAKLGREDRGMRPDQHALAMGLSRDRRHQRCRQVCVQLDRCRPGALRPCHSQPQIRLRSDGLHPGSFSGLNSARRVVSARVCKERRTRHQGGIVNVRRDDFVRAGLTLELGEQPDITGHIANHGDAAV